MSHVDVAIAGFGDAYGDADDPKTPIELAVNAITAALDDAGLSHYDIDGLLTGRRPIADRRPQWNNILANYLNLRVNYSTEVTVHGGGSGNVFRHAMAAINRGFADTVLCTIGDSPAFVGDSIRQLIKLDSDREFEAPYGHFMPGIYAQMATRYLHEYDATEADMAKVAVEARKWGRRHPEAEMYGKDELTVEEVLASRPIASPLKLFDCAPYRTEGTGAAFIVTSAERAEELNDKPVYITGSGEFNSHEYLSGLLEYRRDDGKDLSFTRHGTSEAARQAYEMAGLTPDDIDVFELHTNFTHIGLIELEDVGLCGRGKAAEFVRNGGIDFDGGVPVNTNGGYLSFGQPGISMNPLVEAVRQIRGEALGVQVPDVTHALAHKAGGASACHSINILSGGDSR